MVEKFEPAVWATMFVKQDVTTEPFVVSAGTVKVSQEKSTLYYITPSLSGKRYRLGLGDVFNSFGIKYPEKISLEDANSLLSKLQAQFIKGELKPIDVVTKKKTKKKKKVA